MTAIDSPPVTRSLVQQLASAYAERLSLLRCGAQDDELVENSAVISDLERRYLGRGEQVTIDVRGEGGALHTQMRLDPALYLG